jgi:hypothetical protein
MLLPTLTLRDPREITSRGDPFHFIYFAIYKLSYKAHKNILVKFAIKIDIELFEM